jgi:hypothetical protein
MGVVGYVRDSIRDFAKIAAPLNLTLHNYSKEPRNAQLWSGLTKQQVLLTRLDKRSMIVH